MQKVDCLFVSPNSASAAYQALATRFSAIEPPTWALLLAESCRSRGFGVAILDADAERLSPHEATLRVSDIAPKMICIVVYGQNPNSGTLNMVGAIAIAEQVKAEFPSLPIAIVGSHVSALPDEVLALNCIDIVLLNEGVYALHNLLSSSLTIDDLKKIRESGTKSDTVWY